MKDMKIMKKSVYLRQIDSNILRYLVFSSMDYL